MDTKSLLNKIADKEYERLNHLTSKELADEYADWFQEDMPEDSEQGIAYMVSDFMTYREQESPDELLEVLNRYN